MLPSCDLQLLLLCPHIARSIVASKLLYDSLDRQINLGKKIEHVREGVKYKVIYVNQKLLK